METRQSRMDKYFELEEENNKGTKSSNKKGSSRLQRNQELYKKVSSLDIEGFDLNSNTTVLDGDASDIDIDNIKEQLEEKYHVNPRNKSFGDTDEINLPKINLDETREYDINAILAKAKEQKDIDYEEERHHKVNDVFKDLEEYTNNLKNRESTNNVGVSKENDEEIKELIDTITAKELINEEENLEVSGEMDPLDLLSDLKGDDDNTKVLGQIDEEELEDTTEELNTEEIKELSEMAYEEASIDDTTALELTSEVEESTEELEFTGEVEETTEELELTGEVEESTEELELDDTSELEDTDTSEVVLDDTDDIPTEELLMTKETRRKKKSKKRSKEYDTLSNSFVGKTTTFSQEDFDDFDDLKEDMKITKVIIKILIIIIILVFIVGLVLLANSKFNWGLF